MTKQVALTEKAHERLMILKRVLKIKTMSDTIIHIMNLSYYNDGFFERIREKVTDE